MSRARAGAIIAALLLALASARPAAAGFVTFESGQVRPLALSPDATRLFVTNTPDGRLEVFDVAADGLHHATSVPVGLEPVAVAARTDDEVWVVNHLSDSVSIVRLDTTPPRVVRTLLVGDEPRDVVFAGTGNARAFVTAAHRGQNRPGDPELTTPGVGRADVWVFDALDPGAGLGGTPIEVVSLFGDTPRALAVSPDGAAVYVAVFQSGNQTTTIPETKVCDGGPTALPCDFDGDLMPGGLPGPRENVESTPGPETGLIVRFDPLAGHWVDPLARIWDEAVRFELPDLDVFRLDAATLATTAEFAHVGTVLFNMAVNPASGRVYVSNTEARNEVRFEGPGGGGSTVRGRLHEARITVLDGTMVTPHHLNPHIDYDVVPSPPAVRERSLAQPLGMAVSADGATLWVAAFGSDVVGIVDTAALEAGAFVPDAADHIAVSGGGPSGVVLDATRDRLYVLTRFDNAVSVIDAASRQETAHLPLHNPEPASVVDGRRFLYDARATSSNGEASCASCHVFGDLDSLAWDLGNPDAPVVPNPNPIHLGEGPSFHPLKGPMTTQTLRGMATHGPMHWRGDRTGGNRAGGGDPLAEDQAFAEFLVAFESLLGRDAPIAETDMERFGAFVLQIASPPNPVRALDGSLTADEQAGRDLYFGRVTDLDDDCSGCHTLAPRSGAFGTDGQTAQQGAIPQMFKIPHFRNLYQKVGMFAGFGAGPQIRGFGFTHDGSADTIFRFLLSPQFTLADSERRDLERFLLAFDAELPPVVGQQVTLTATNVAEAGPRIDLLLARNDEGDCDLVAHGVQGGEARGWARLASGLFATDRVADAAVGDADLRALAGTSGQEVTFTCVPLGSGARVAIDRDADGFLDHDEIDAGTDPADRTSTPDGTAVPLDRVLVRTSTLRLLAGRGVPTEARLTFASRTAKDDATNRVVPPPRGSSADPTVRGAVLYVSNAGFTNDLVTIPLAASGWRQVGSEQKQKGYRFRGKDAGGGPIKSVVLGPDTLRIRGTIPYSLDEAGQGRVSVRLTPDLFSDAGWCASAPGRPHGAQGSTAKNDRPGRFVATPKTAPPAVCPPLP